MGNSIDTTAICCVDCCILITKYCNICRILLVGHFPTRLLDRGAGTISYRFLRAYWMGTCEFAFTSEAEECTEVIHHMLARGSQCSFCTSHWRITDPPFFFPCTKHNCSKKPGNWAHDSLCYAPQNKTFRPFNTLCIATAEFATQLTVDSATAIHGPSSISTKHLFIKHEFYL